jgi:hypothetical protein
VLKRHKVKHKHIRFTTQIEYFTKSIFANIIVRIAEVAKLQVNIFLGNIYKSVIILTLSVKTNFNVLRKTKQKLVIYTQIE